MSSSTDPGHPRPEAPLTVVPVSALPYPGPPGFVLFLRWLMRLAFAASLALNVVLLLMLAGYITTTDSALSERTYAGRPMGDKIAVVHIEGTIMEGMIGFARRQIEQAAADNQVKCVVLRINSPGGTVTASDSLYQQLVKLRDGDPHKRHQPKPLVVSMGSLAASGGYYIAMPAKVLFAERTTITGSIGVFAAFPNVSELAKRYGFKMDVIKAGEVKDSGSMFKEMTPQERQLWQDMIDHSFAEFLAVIERGRPALRGKLREPVIERDIPATPEGTPAKPGAPGKVKYVRRRADGGIYTADQAKAFGLIDQIGYLDDAIAEAKRVAGLPEDSRVITYERPTNFWANLLGLPTFSQASATPDLGRLEFFAAPRLWYLAPQSELAGLLGGLRVGNREEP